MRWVGYWEDSQRRACALFLSFMLSAALPAETGTGRAAAAAPCAAGADAVRDMGAFLSKVFESAGVHGHALSADAAQRACGEGVTLAELQDMSLTELRGLFASEHEEEAREHLAQHACTAVAGCEEMDPVVQFADLRYANDARGDKSGGEQHRDHAQARRSQSPAGQHQGRFEQFMDAVCRRCAYSGFECGCELGEENPAFEVLRNYAVQYNAWRSTLLHHIHAPEPPWSDSVWDDIGMYVCMRVCMSVCLSVRMHVHMHACMYACIYECM